jgi:hypothetical protein
MTINSQFLPIEKPDFIAKASALLGWTGYRAKGMHALGHCFEGIPPCYKYVRRTGTTLSNDAIDISLTWNVTKIVLARRS